MSLIPAFYNFVIYEGATFYDTITYKLGGEIQDLTDFSVSIPIKDKPDGNLLLTLDTDLNGGVVLGGVEGTIEITIDAATTADLTWAAGQYELFITDTTPRTDVLLRGAFKVVPF